MTRSRGGPAALPPTATMAGDPSSGTSNSHREKSLAALRKFRQIFRAVQKHYQWVQAHCGVSGAQLWALCEIARLPGMRVGDLARVGICIAFARGPGSVASFYLLAVGLSVASQFATAAEGAHYRDRHGQFAIGQLRARSRAGR